MPADPDRLRRHPELTLLSDNLPRFLLDLARIGREAARSPDFARSVRHATRWFSPNTGQPWIRPLSTVEWEQSGYDTAVLDGLPPGSHLAVLSGMPLPSDLCFHRAPHWSYGRPLERLDFLTPDLVLAIPTRQGDTSH
ncbi:hypothetical protein DN402_02795 [Streptomyces sp. SW4]|nr:hypothetical protein DN402_02795 [Streptomyces sp. SW4]